MKLHFSDGSAWDIKITERYGMAVYRDRTPQEEKTYRKRIRRKKILKFIRPFNPFPVFKRLKQHYDYHYFPKWVYDLTYIPREK